MFVLSIFELHKNIFHQTTAKNTWKTTQYIIVTQHTNRNYKIPFQKVSRDSALKLGPHT